MQRRAVFVAHAMIGVDANVINSWDGGQILIHGAVVAAPVGGDRVMVGISGCKMGAGLGVPGAQIGTTASR